MHPSASDQPAWRRALYDVFQYSAKGMSLLLMATNYVQCRWDYIIPVDNFLNSFLVHIVAAGWLGVVKRCELRRLAAESQPRPASLARIGSR